jgi:hypothetical protein
MPLAQAARRAGMPLVALAISATIAEARQAAPDSVQQSTTAAPSPRSRGLAAATVGLGVNLFINRVDAWILKQDWARVTPSTWSRNLRLGWEWDEDQFVVNMFSHPYHGSLYFNAGRTHGLDFWGSMPLVFLGSWTWERFGETYQPSLNDFFMTSIGGVALGEVTHRLAWLLRGDRGRSAAPRNLLALVMDPVGGLYEFAGNTRVNPPERPPAFALRLAGGARAVSETGRSDNITGGATFFADMYYGDPFTAPYRAPYDVFTMHAQLSSDGSGLDALRATGRLWALELTPEHVLSRHQFTVSQAYEFTDNAAWSFGGQSVTAGLVSRFQMPRDVELHTTAAAEAIIMGAVDAPGAGVGERSYDFGPGFGLVATAKLRRHQRVLASAAYHTAIVNSVSGANAQHYTHRLAFEVEVPLPAGFALGWHGGYFHRSSSYEDAPGETRRFPEGRIYLAWTSGW